MTRTLFSDVMIFDGSGSELFPGSVMVEGNRIAAVVPAGESFDANGANVVDGQRPHADARHGGGARASDLAELRSTA